MPVPLDRVRSVKRGLVRWGWTLLGREARLKLSRTPGDSVVRLGSSYGGWNVLPLPSLRQGLVVSCGLGEDASFDVEIARLFGARVIIVDPTPRAISHFEALVRRVGLAQEVPLSESGSQPARAYNLSGVSTEQFALCACALWSVDGTVRFFSPKDSRHVSHSVLEDFAAMDAGGLPQYIEAQAITYTTLCARYGLDNTSLLKLDIEGAECDVLSDVIRSHNLPQQVLVEFDVLRRRTVAAARRVEEVHELLLGARYALVWREGRNATYVLRD